MEKLIKYDTNIDILLGKVIEHGSRIADYIELGKELARIKKLAFASACIRDLQAMLADANQPASVLSRALTAYTLDETARGMADTSDAACPLNNGLVGLGWSLYQLAGKTITIIKKAIKSHLPADEVAEMFLDTARLSKKAWLAKYDQVVEKTATEIIDGALERISNVLLTQENLAYFNLKLADLLKKRETYLAEQAANAAAVKAAQVA
jgi:hypothetical protein